MGAKNRIICGAILCGAALGIAIGAPRATSRAAQGAEEPVPAFHNEAPKGQLPETVSPSQFTNGVVQNAYLLAARVKKVLYQQPCYCHCDRSQGHTSLLDCFASKHGSGCDVCIREAIYSYEQTHKGKTAAQIRAGIEGGEWREVDMSKYATPVAAK
jgi:hypothetical protein